MDKLIHFRLHADSAHLAVSDDCLARYMCTKHSWRGKYRRVFCVLPGCIITQHPDTLAVTNTYAFLEESDLENIGIGGDVGDEQEFTLFARQDKKQAKFKPIKFTCKCRTALLTDLYYVVAAASAAKRSLWASKFLGTIPRFSAVKLRRGRWVPCTLQISLCGVERICAVSSRLKWRLEFRQLVSPAVSLLSPPVGGGAAGAPAGGVFALHGKHGRAPRVYACAQRDAFLKAMQARAAQSYGMSLIVEPQEGITGEKMLTVVSDAHREQSEMSREAPIGEWETLRLKPLLDLPSETSSSNVIQGGGMAVYLKLRSHNGGASTLSQPPSGTAVPRSIVLTPAALLERRRNTFDIAERRPLQSVAALVRFWEEAQHLGIQWSDGSLLTVYVTPARDAMLAALLDAAQNAAGRPIPVLAEPTLPGDIVVSARAATGISMAVSTEAEVERLSFGHLMQAGRDYAASAWAMVRSDSGNNGGTPLAGISGQSTQLANDGEPEEGSPAHLKGAQHPATNFARGLFGEAKKALSKTANDINTGILHSVQLTPEETRNVLILRIRQFNACVPFTGLGADMAIEEHVLSALIALLPPPSATGTNVKPFLDSEACRIVLVIQCLQRLVSSPSVAASILGVPGCLPRLFVALAHGSEHPSAEVLRLMVRLWAPAATRAGMAPWMFARGSILETEEAVVTNSPEENAMARAAKSVTMASLPRCMQLLAPLVREPQPSPLLSMAALEALGAAVCEPGARTTDPPILSQLLASSASLGRPLFRLAMHPANRGADGAALLMRAIAESGASAALPMREAALREGAFLHHLIPASFGKGHRAQLSRDLVSLWADEFGTAAALLRRIFPPGLLRYLNVPKPQISGRPNTNPLAPARRPCSEERPKSTSSDPSTTEALSNASNPSAATPKPASASANASGGTPALIGPNRDESGPAHKRSSATLKSPAVTASGVSAPLTRNTNSEKVQESQPTELLSGSSFPTGATVKIRGPHTLKGNWEAFWAAIQQNHHHAGLVWNERTRAELREALEAEDAALRLGRQRVGQGAGQYPCWNYSEFRVIYNTLANELCIGGVYLRLLLDGLQESSVEKLANPKDFFHALYHRFLCSADQGLLECHISVSDANQIWHPVGRFSCMHSFIQMNIYID
mmetsp:Transcript_48085/g.121362  ORF Transcript_48085/g.121362 Transcript_48085/m.121362 type:complete len:1147 (+) Transcript_48085:107-3547(+)